MISVAFFPFFFLAQNDSNANVEVNQNFPEGVPREVDITGSPGSVDLAVAMVEEAREENCAALGCLSAQ